MERRHTIQKDMVLEAVQNLHSHATADEVYDYIRASHPTIGKGTVYRNLKVLSQEGSIRRIEIPNAPDRFDHRLDKHYHARCLRCHRTFDVDTAPLPDLMQQIRDFGGFDYQGVQVMFYGICPDCQASAKEDEE